MMDSNVQPEHCEAGKPSRQTRLNHYFRTERKMWATLLLLPLLTYCVVAVLTYTIKPTPISTGDALYDKYLAWVADDLVVNYISDSYYEDSRVNPRTYEVADPFGSWVQEFGDDPRYWMLRFRHSKSMEMNEWGYREPDIRILKRARELGLADGAILLVLLNEIDSRYSENLDFTYLSTPHTPEAAAEWQKYKRDAIDDQAGVRHNQLLGDLLEVAGDESLPHYYAALCDAQRGSYEAALLHLANGNRAPSNSSLIGFPLEKAYSDLESINPLPDKLISGSVLAGNTTQLLPDYIQAKNLGKLMVAEAIKREDKAALDEIHTFACRYGSAGGGSGITFLVGTVMIGEVESEFRKNLGSSLDTQQISNLAKLTTSKGQVTTLARAATVFPPTSNPGGLPSLQETWSFLEGKLSGGRSKFIQNSEGFYDGSIKLQSKLINPIKQLFQQMESFNYNTLEFE